MQIPGIWTAGDTITWVDSVAFDNQGNAITPSAWTLAYSIRGPSSLDLASTTGSGGWSVTALGTATAALIPGNYWWQATAIRIADGARFTVGTGQLLVQLDLENVTVTVSGGGSTPGTTTTDITATAATTISSYIAVAASGAGIIPADSATVAIAGSVIGIATTAANAGGSVTVQTEGVVSFSGWNWTVGVPVFIGAGGVLTQAAPDIGFLQIIGTADAPGSIVISLEPPIIL